MLLDAERIVRELQHFGIVDAEALALGRRRIDIHRAVRAVAIGVDQLALLAAERTSQHASVAGAERRLVNVELVGVDAALDDVLAQAPGAGDEDDVGNPDSVSSVKTTPLDAWSE